jgi:hypothetical protein
MSRQSGVASRRDARRLGGEFGHPGETAERGSRPGWKP